MRVGTDPNAADQFNVMVGPPGRTVDRTGPAERQATRLALPIDVGQTITGTTANANGPMKRSWGENCGGDHPSPRLVSHSRRPTTGSTSSTSDGSPMLDTEISAWDAVCDSGENGGYPPPRLLHRQQRARPRSAHRGLHPERHFLLLR